MTNLHTESSFDGQWPSTTACYINHTVNNVNENHINGVAPQKHEAVYLNGDEFQPDPSTSDGKDINDIPSQTPGHDATPRCRVPIAICGMALRLPGDIMTPSQFWEFLLSKGDARSRVPKSRYNISGFYSKSGKPGTITTEHGYFLDDMSINIASLDTSFFSMTRGELERCDPQQRQLLEVTRECFESAGEIDYRGKDIGCYVGSFGEDWCELFATDKQPYGMYRITGFGDFVLSNRISYEYDLKGPSMTIRTGCSSALIGLHEACVAIETGECSAAIIGGANLIMAPGMTSAETEQGVLSPEGSCRTFDADANGYARAEAINAVYIKRLDNALRDGNPIRAVIRATVTNCDGKTPGISNPSSEAHEAMIRHAYAVAGLNDFAQTGFVECHGTGTAIGDPLEAQAVANVFGDVGVHIGSVKPNIGHSEGASGITSLIKTVLALENKTIPPNIKFSKPNPKIPFKSRQLKVPLDPTPWPQNRCERASVNSFGIGGANAHVILDSAASFKLPKLTPKLTPKSPMTLDGVHLLVYSANATESLRKQVVNHQKYLDDHPESLGDLAYTLNLRRERLPHRAFSVVGKGLDANTSSFTRAPTSAPDVVMIFTGQGAQWPQMGMELIQLSEVFRNSIRGMDKTLRKLPNPPNWSIEAELLQPPETSKVQKPALSQPLCTAIQVGLVDTLASFGVNPSAVVGHSSGEIAAAYAAGALSADGAIVASYYRGIVAQQASMPGGMAAIGMSWEETSQFLVDGVVIACENSPVSVTISGDLGKVEDVLDAIQKARPEVMARALKVDRAYHSHHMKELGKAYYEFTVDQITGRPPSDAVSFFSTVSGEQLKSFPGPRYWQSNLESPVLFRTAIVNLLKCNGESNKLFLEIGPHSALAGPLRQTLTEAGVTAPYVAAMVRNKSCAESLLSCVGNLHLNSVSINFAVLTDPTEHKVLADLPPYPWHHDNSFWYESRLAKEWRHRKFLHHDILGLRVSESTDFEPSWRNILHLDNAPWIRDHKIKEDIVFPCAGYIGMVGEAVHQLTVGSMEGKADFAGYRLRHVVVHTALVLADGKPTELMTSLRKHTLTDSLDSAWWDFTVSSHNGNGWTKHCVGQVEALSDAAPGSGQIDPLPRKVESAAWYNTMSRVGLNYGIMFQGLTDITAATVDNLATAKTVDTAPDDSTEYPLHPTTIDFFLQLLGVADTQGISRRFKTLAVPTNIDEVSVWASSPGLSMRVSATSTQKGTICGDGHCVDAEGRMVLQMKGVKLSPLVEEVEDGSADPHAAARIEWKPDIDLLDITENKLIQPVIDREDSARMLEELTDLYVMTTEKALHGLQATLPHMQKYQTWLERYTSRAGSLGSCDELDSINTLSDKLSTTAAAPAAKAMRLIFENASLLLANEIEPLQVLMTDSTLTYLYNFLDEVNRTPFIQLLAHSKPNLRVLEIGAGTGGTTNSILSDLTSGDRRMYSNYTFTDISSGFFPAARERFSSYPNIEYMALDISKDPVGQGLEAESYDLVLASNVLHATPSLQQTLTHVRKLLAPNGRLLLQELCPKSKWINYIMGVLPGWWPGEGDGREDEPYISPSRWDNELKSAGFAGCEAVILDEKEPCQINANMVVRPAPSQLAKKRVTLLCERNDNRLANTVTSALSDRGYEVSFSELQGSPPQGQDVFAIIDIDSPFFEGLSPDRFEAFKTWIANVGDGGIFWLTRSSQVQCHDPRFALTIGAARTIRTEMSIDFCTCELDDVDKSLDSAMRVFEKFQRRSHNDVVKPEYEYVIESGVVQIGRFSPFSISQQLTGDRKAESTDESALTLGISKYGRLNTLSWTASPSADLKDGEVEIETKAVGINFKDVLIANGIVEPLKPGFGFEVTGVVKRVTPSVKNVAVGDRVMAYTEVGFSSRVVVLWQMCSKIPETLSFEDGATMPVVYGTVIYSLIDVGRLEKGQSILIHSACGGVGISAIQISQMIGAEIYCTVGNQEKVEYLISTFNIPRNRIFNSRNTSFLADLKRETEGRGVDLVLNSLSGELLHASWQCVAEFGKMVEIGKRDLIGHGRLAMQPFLDNRSYCCVDLGHILLKKLELSNRLLNLVVNFFVEGKIQPIRPVKTFSAAEIQDCFRYMQKGQHIGKIIVDMTPKPDHPLSAKAAMEPLQLDPEGSYLLIGGLGGLGKAIATWMVEHGARHLVFLSRSAGSTASDKAFIAELKSQNVTVTVIQGSVSELADVERAVNASHKPLRGILQMSMALRDQSFLKMTSTEWSEAVTPKVQGTMNLHKATKDTTKLDFFVLFSSLSGVIGMPGQANYAAANTFLDAFVQYRHHLGLAASAIDIGAMEDVGYLASNTGLAARLKATGAYGVRETELLDALTLAIMESQPVITTTPTPSAAASTGQFVLGLRSSTSLDDPSNRALWKRDIRMSWYHNPSSQGDIAQTSGGGSNSKLKEFLSSATANPDLLKEKASAIFLAEEIGKKLFDFLLRPVEELDLAVPLQDMGMDSLMAIEVRSWWKQTFGFEISVLEILGKGSIAQLGEHCAQGLLSKMGGGDEKDAGYLAMKAP